MEGWPQYEGLSKGVSKIDQIKSRAGVKISTVSKDSVHPMRAGVSPKGRAFGKVADDAQSGASARCSAKKKTSERILKGKRSEAGKDGRGLKSPA